MTPPENAPLAQVFRYNGWANARVVEACRSLTGEQLDARAQGAEERTVRETLLHLVDGQRAFLARLHGEAQPPGGPARWAGFDPLLAALAATDAALIDAATSLADDEEVVVPFMDRRPVFPKSFFLAHAVAHGAQHRAEICAMLRAVGAESPDLDGWAYAGAAGFGREEGPGPA